MREGWIDAWRRWSQGKGWEWGFTAQGWCPRPVQDDKGIVQFATKGHVYAGMRPGLLTARSPVSRSGWGPIQGTKGHAFLAGVCLPAGVCAAAVRPADGGCTPRSVRCSPGG